MNAHCDFMRHETWVMMVAGTEEIKSCQITGLGLPEVPERVDMSIKKEGPPGRLCVELGATT